MRTEKIGPAALWVWSGLAHDAKTPERWREEMRAAVQRCRMSTAAGRLSRHDGASTGVISPIPDSGTPPYWLTTVSSPNPSGSITQRTFELDTRRSRSLAGRSFRAPGWNARALSRWFRSVR